MISQNLNSVFVFGSVARGDSDRFSDRDVLLVDDRNGRRRNEVAALTRKGWSCSSYSWGRLERLISDGSLFAQHLKQEAIVLHDEDHRLRDILSSFQPRTCFHQEYSSAVSVLATLEALPDSHIGRLWAMDVLMVGFRGAAISLLGNEGIYSFSYEDILQNVARVRDVDKRYLSPLRRLRYWKARYRSHRFESTPSWDELIRTIECVDKMLGLGMHARRRSVEDVYDLVLSQPHVLGNWYAESRRVEIAIRNLLCGDYGFDAEVRARSYNLLTRIQRPTDYGWWLSKRKDVARSLFGDMLQWARAA